MAHPSGICKYKDCDKPSVAEGYCAFHYDVISKQEARQINSAMIKVLSAMNDRLQSIEEKLANQQPVVITQPANPSSTDNVVKEVKQEKPRPPSSVFIPAVNLGNAAVIKDVKTASTKKDINALAEQLKATGG